jgi:MoaA/NifB/PqqE/SkfB family radical SAM enzyme
MKLPGGNLVALGTGLVLHHLTGRRAPLAATIAVTNRCNLRCRYCACDRRRMPEMSTAQVEALIAALRDRGAQKIGFTGGEPLVRPDIFALVDHAKRRGLITHLVTNGTLLDAAAARRLRGLDVLFVSWDGPAAVNASIRTGTRGDVLDGIRLALAAGLKVCALTTIVTQNIPHLSAMAARARELGFTIIFSPLHRHDCAAADLRELEPDPATLTRAIDGLIRLKRAGYPVANSYSHLRFARAWPHGPAPRCYAGKLYLVVDANGDVYPCWPAMGATTPVNCFRHGFATALARPTGLACEGCNFACHHELNFLLSLRPDAILNLLTS